MADMCERFEAMGYENQDLCERLLEVCASLRCDLPLLPMGSRYIGEAQKEPELVNLCDIARRLMLRHEANEIEDEDVEVCASLRCDLPLLPPGPRYIGEALEEEPELINLCDIARRLMLRQEEANEMEDDEVEADEAKMINLVEVARRLMSSPEGADETEGDEIEAETKLINLVDVAKRLMLRQEADEIEADEIKAEKGEEERPALEEEGALPSTGSSLQRRLHPAGGVAADADALVSRTSPPPRVASTSAIGFDSARLAVGLKRGGWEARASTARAPAVPPLYQKRARSIAASPSTPLVPTAAAPPPRSACPPVLASYASHFAASAPWNQEEARPHEPAVRLDLGEASYSMDASRRRGGFSSSMEQRVTKSLPRTSTLPRVVLASGAVEGSGSKVLPPLQRGGGGSRISDEHFRLCGGEGFVEFEKAACWGQSFRPIAKWSGRSRLANAGNVLGIVTVAFLRTVSVATIG
eukprot:TRINITY_DN3532_c0_g1_i4.p1 TRINITY_DN3532_c0_g1~~TRINITY_DN3532_c0_g1_i4.p1  ORF type:complete len:497 (-),score=114.02 TRINITY_DN3532_c0_g1_i4:55-1467(-)